MSDTPDLGPPPERIRIEAPQVRRLVEDQFPGWAGLPIEPVAKGGWDNWTFHLGTDMVVRLPSAAEYAQAVEKEHTWLPRLAPLLPLTTPTPLALGTPSSAYPHAWSVYRWIDGQTASPERITRPVDFAADLATFLLALRAVDPAHGPQPGIHNWYRGGTLRTFDTLTRRNLDDLTTHVDVDLASTVWAEALGAPWDGIDRWFHGDLAEGNLLLTETGGLCAVIDFGTCGVGDPACDLAVAWTLLSTDRRRAFRDSLAVDESTWTRGRGWALWKSLATCLSSLAEEGEFERAKRILETILEG